MNAREEPSAARKNLPKDKWAAHVAMKKMDEMAGNFVQIDEDGSEAQVSAMTQPTRATTTSSDSNEMPSWMSNFNSFSQMTSELFKNALLLDSQGGSHLICNPMMVTNVRKIKGGTDLHTNVGSRRLNTVADMDGVGAVWYDNKAISNVISQAELKDSGKFRIKYSDDNDEYTVTHLPSGKTIKFTRYGNHYVNFPHGFQTHPNTVAENQAMHTKHKTRER